MENQIQDKIMLSDLTLADRAAFYKKTYAHVAGGVLAFILFEYLLLQSETIVQFALSMTEGYRWLLMLGGFMFITNYAESTALRTADKNKQYLAYGIYILAEAFIFVPLIYIAAYYLESGPEILNQAAIVTLALFTGLSAIVFLTRKDFSFLKTGLVIGFFIAIGLIIAGTIFGFNLGLWFSVGMCLLAGGAILYQTSNLVNKYGKEDYIPAAIGLFASLMLLFWYVLRIFSRD
ncbi:Bax inhibitor-1 family protein [Sinomicrobium kalidii]|uniref:Bax inhibitor-1/YccA family protein n=1 Tax=Sinomicrobium kalidii TaxID=2900738 RepID=UPI001E2CB87F|nr:Bax inhibitor-1 family protein [Sinomicrobium kalidii]UGU14781.1 Bax inhibitor-1 family protein [Sinomicrobium kalidii]